MPIQITRDSSKAVSEPVQLELDLEKVGYRESREMSGMRALRQRAKYSTPFQQYSSLLQGADFLRRLGRVRETPGLKRYLRGEVLAFIRHYPREGEFEKIIERGMNYRPRCETGTIPEPPEMPEVKPLGPRGVWAK
jgi:hypothetical protein